jgi:hypothetical protein
MMLKVALLSFFIAMTFDRYQTAYQKAKCPDPLPSVKPEFKLEKVKIATLVFKKFFKM